LGECVGEGQIPVTTRIILSHHNYQETPNLRVLRELRDDMFNDGADIVKIVTMAKDVSDSIRVMLTIAGAPGMHVEGRSHCSKAVLEP
jgi:3-dehydroquinate dehydratase type I